MLNKNKKAILGKNHDNNNNGIKKDFKKNDYFLAIKSLEIDSVIVNRRARKIAYLVAGISCVLSIFLCCALIVLLPLKEVQPYVIRVDQNTGYVDIAKPLDESKSSNGDEIDKYFLAKYVVNYESYDWETIQHMSDTVKLMSNNQIFSHYDHVLRSDVSPLSLFRDQRQVICKVLSVSFINDVATVRFVKFVRNKNGDVDSSYPTTKWLATIKFDYKKSIKKENERLINPLGFQVLSYRVDPEAL